MNSPIAHLFATQKQYRLFLLLCLTTLFDLSMVGYRMYFVGFDFSEIYSIQDLANARSASFMFLVWNLVLAWVPYLIAISLEKMPAQKILAIPMLLAWLVFFPNAPYIVTDLLHVGYRHGVPLWYDVMMIFSFAWTGLLLGFLSLLEVQRFLEGKLSKKWAVTFTWVAIGLCAFGVYLGRYQRWNTWDLFLNPYQIFDDLMAVLFHPGAYMGSLGLAVVMAGVLGVGYLTMRTLVRE